VKDVDCNFELKTLKALILRGFLDKLDLFTATFDSPEAVCTKSSICPQNCLAMRI
jgi:hypothetical protein